MVELALWVPLLFVAEYALDLTLDLLNLQHSRRHGSVLPPELEGSVPVDKQLAAQAYLRDSTRFGMVHSTYSLLVFLGFLAWGGFEFFDRVARGWASHPWLAGLYFVGLLSLANGIIEMPFSIYSTFVLEEKHGFNRTTPRTFVVDRLKGLLLAVVLGAPIFVAVCRFFEALGPGGWWIVWLAFAAFNLLLAFLAPVLIFPLFNKFKPLPEGVLKSAIDDYARSQSFRMSGVFVMDGSTRSAKTNAFFTGFGRTKKLALFDTLIEKQSAEEIVAVVAHEVGHFKEGHIPKSIGLGLITMGILFFTLSRFLNNESLFHAFGMQNASVYGSLVLMSFVYSPVSRALSLFPNWFSRKNEFEADRYSLRTYGNPQALTSALKKLSTDNLSNLSPHPWKVAMDYTHPPVIKRIRALRASAHAGGPGPKAPA